MKQALVVAEIHSSLFPTLRDLHSRQCGVSDVPKIKPVAGKRSPAVARACRAPAASTDAAANANRGSSGAHAGCMGNGAHAGVAVVRLQLRQGRAIASAMSNGHYYVSYASVLILCAVSSTVLVYQP